MHISCSVTTSYLAGACTRTRTTYAHLQTWVNKHCSDVCVCVCFLYVMQNTELFTSRSCLSFFTATFFPTCLSVCLFLSFFPSVWLKLSLPYLPAASSPLPLCLSRSSTEKWVMSKEKSDREKAEMRSNLILIWFLLGSCFNPLWAGFSACTSVCVWKSHSQRLERESADSHHSHHIIRQPIDLFFCCNQQKVKPILTHITKYRTYIHFLFIF